MKILFIAHESQLNGASKSLLDLIKEFENKHEIYVLTAFNKGPFMDELQKTKARILIKPYYRSVIYKKNQGQWFTEKFKWHIKRKFINKVTVAQMVKFCTDNKIDIIHTNSSVIDIGGQIAKKAKIKHVWHIREFADLDFEMYPYVSKRRYQETMARQADILICNSNAVAKHFDFLPTHKVNVVYNGVSTENIIDYHRTDVENITKFLLAGRYSLAKGQDDAILACKKLIELGITNFVLGLAGSKTERIAIPKSIMKNICIYGEVQDMPSLRKKVDVELVCSRAEAFGRVTIEAMMAGIPVIGSNTGGTPELIKDYDNGLLYDYGNVTELASKMKFMIENTQARLEMGKRAKKFALNFTSKNCAENIEQIYFKMLEGGH